MLQLLPLLMVPTWAEAGPEPASRPLTITEYMDLRFSEVPIQYETLEEYADRLGLTMEELAVRSQAYWDDATTFEYNRALNATEGEDDILDIGTTETATAGPEPFPYLVCRMRMADTDTDTESDTGTAMSGLAHMLAIDEAVSAAYESAGVAAPAPMMTTDVSNTLANTDDLYCAFARLPGAVAEALSCGDVAGGVECAVQPLLFSMKLMPDSIQTIVDAVRNYYDSTPEDKAISMAETEIPDEDEEATEAVEIIADGSETEFDGGPTPHPKPTPVLPSLDVLLCPGVVDEETIAKYGAGAGAGAADPEAGLIPQVPVIDIRDRATQWLLKTTGEQGTVATTKGLVSQYFYWTSDAAAQFREESGYTEPELAEFLGEMLDLAIETDLCTNVYENGLDWTGIFLPRTQIVHVDHIETASEDPVDQACILSLAVALSILPEVCAVEVTPINEPLNERAQWIVQSYKPDERPFFDAGITGEGQVVAVSDTGVDVNNCYFRDEGGDVPNVVPNENNRKIVQYWPHADDVDLRFGHGTHVAGTVLGQRDDGETGLAQGVAPGAKLAFCDIGNDKKDLLLPPNTELLATGRVDGMSTKAHIHSASWGSAINFYSFQARQFDDIIFGEEDLLVNVAAGNSGRFDALNTVGSPAVSKNILSVGASQSAPPGIDPKQDGPAYLADFSSRGTTGDGRMKPDLVAPGETILSAGARPGLPYSCDPPDGNLPRLGMGRDGLVWMAGTSMATPVTSGTAALVREYFAKGYYPDGVQGSGPAITNPSAALMKAVLMNGAQYISGVDNSPQLGIDTPAFPYDDAQGFGRVSLIDSLRLADKNDVRTMIWDREVIDNLSVKSYDVTIETPDDCETAQLRATLIWAEPGSTPGCRACLTNDLDLTAISHQDPATVYYPNGLSGPDRINNAERVIVSGASNGDTVTISVDAHNLSMETMTYALVATTVCIDGRQVADESSRPSKPPSPLDATSAGSGPVKVAAPLAVGLIVISCLTFLTSFAASMLHVLL